MKTLNLNQPVYYQSKSRFNNQPIQVDIIKIDKNNVTVRTTGVDISTTFKCRKSSLFN